MNFLKDMFENCTIKNKFLLIFSIIAFMIGFTSGFDCRAHALVDINFNEIYADAQEVQLIGQTHDNIYLKDIWNIIDTNGTSHFEELVKAHPYWNTYDKFGYFIVNDRQDWEFEIYFFTYTKRPYKASYQYSINPNNTCMLIKFKYDNNTLLFDENRITYTTITGNISHMASTNWLYDNIWGYFGRNIILDSSQNSGVEYSGIYVLGQKSNINITWNTTYIDSITSNIVNLAEVTIGSNYNLTNATIEVNRLKIDRGSTNILEVYNALTIPASGDNILYINKNDFLTSTNSISYEWEINVKFGNTIGKNDVIYIPVLIGGSSSEETSGEIGYVSGEEINGNINSSGDLNINVDNIINSSINNTNKIIENDNKNTDRIVSGEKAIVEAIQSGDNAILGFFKSNFSGDLYVPEYTNENPGEPFYIDFYNHLINGLKYKDVVDLVVPIPNESGELIGYHIPSNILQWENEDLDPYIQLIWEFSFGYAFIKWVYFLYENLSKLNIDDVTNEIERDKDIL